MSTKGEAWDQLAIYTSLEELQHKLKKLKIELLGWKYMNPHFPSIVDIQCGEKAILL